MGTISGGFRLSNGTSISRTKLDADLTVNVSQDDSGDFTTIGAALNHVGRKLDLSGYQLVIQVAPGDYTAEGLLHLPPIVGGKAETCRAAPSPPNTQIRMVGIGSIVAGFELDNPGFYSLENFEFQADTGGTGGLVTAQRGGVIEINNATFEGEANTYNKSAIASVDNGLIYLSGDIYLSDNFICAFKVISNSQVKIAEGKSCQVYINESLNVNYFFDVEDFSILALNTANFYINYGQIR